MGTVAQPMPTPQDPMAQLLNAFAALAPQFGSGKTSSSETSGGGTSTTSESANQIQNSTSTSGSSGGSTTSNSLDPETAQQFQELMGMIQKQNTSQDLDNVVGNILERARQAFGPNIMSSIAAGNRVYSDTTLGQIQNEAIARATGEAAQARLSAVTANNKIASDLVSQKMANTRQQQVQEQQQNQNQQQQTQAKTGNTVTVKPTTSTTKVSSTGVSPAGNLLGLGFLGLSAYQKAKKVLGSSGGGSVDNPFAGIDIYSADTGGFTMGDVVGGGSAGLNAGGGLSGAAGAEGNGLFGPATMDAAMGNNDDVFNALVENFKKQGTTATLAGDNPLLIADSGSLITDIPITDVLSPGNAALTEDPILNMGEDATLTGGGTMLGSAGGDAAMVGLDDAAITGGGTLATSGSDLLGSAGGEVAMWGAEDAAITGGGEMAIPGIGIASAVQTLNGGPSVTEAAGEALDGVADVANEAGSFVSDIWDDTVGAVTGGGGGSVICTELVRQGLFKKEDLEKDILYGHANFNREEFAGYHLWAKPYVQLMQKSKLATYCVLPFARAFFFESVYRYDGTGRTSRLGRFLHKWGPRACEFLATNFITPQEYFNG